MIIQHVENSSQGTTTFEPPHDKTNKITVRPVKTQFSLGGAQQVKDPGVLHVDSEDSDQTGRMPRLIWVFAGCTVILLIFVMRQHSFLLANGLVVFHFHSMYFSDSAKNYWNNLDRLKNPTEKKKKKGLLSKSVRFWCETWSPPSLHKISCCHMGRVKRIWYLSPMRAAKVQASLRIRAVSPEPPLLAHTSSESRGTSDRKPDPWPLWMAGHAQLKFVMTECSKTQICLTRLICNFVLK